MRVYIAGPIAGVHEPRSKFLNAAVYLEGQGHVAVNPFDVPAHDHGDQDCPEGPHSGEDSGHTAPCHMRADIKALLECDAAFMLRGWPYSSGARTEFEVARACGLDLLFERDLP